MKKVEWQPMNRPHLELCTDDLDLEIVHKNDAGEPVRLLGTVNICGTNFHVSCERVQDDEEQSIYEGGCDEAVVAIQSLDHNERQQTVSFEGYSGDWLVVFSPHCV